VEILTFLIVEKDSTIGKPFEINGPRIEAAASGAPAPVDALQTLILETVYWLDNVSSVLV
jgi:hypothetical protein